jgi:hypothetical protein
MPNDQLLIILAQALDPEGNALAPLQQAYELGYRAGFDAGSAASHTTTAKN